MTDTEHDVEGLDIQNQSDEELLSIFRRTRDNDACAELFRRYEHQLKKFISTFLRDDCFIQDVLQDTFIHFIEGIHEFEEGRRVAPWLFGIAKWTAYTHRRRRMRQEQHEQPLILENIEDKGEQKDSAELSAIRVELREAFMQVIDTLDPDPLKKRVAELLLRGVSQREIARKMNYPWGTVYYWIQQVKVLLHEKLEHMGLDAYSLEEIPFHKGGRRVIRKPIEHHP